MSSVQTSLVLVICRHDRVMVVPLALKPVDLLLEESDGISVEIQQCPAGDKTELFPVIN